MNCDPRLTRSRRRVVARLVAFALGPVTFATACAAVTRLVPGGADTHAFAGVWVDSTKATPTDTVAWKLDPNGNDWTLEIKVVSDNAGHTATERHETRYGYWYLRGAAADSADRALCIKVRPRDGATCYAFQLDTIRSASADTRPRRRLVVLGYQGQQHKRTRVLLERLP
ncbi:MAG: hypothetical protein ACHQQ3_04265 [Gemmatimonadales bacterium]